MSYREQWVADILGDRSVLDVALDVHMTARGSFERSNTDQKLDVTALRRVLATWDNLHACEFDDLVMQLIQAAVTEDDMACLGPCG